ncbi:MAG: hypothetical protein IJ087_22285 [Eggerthellaceae bacterium]|nr:hypothetical protein [Eggerthellaceae bacterium]
MNVGAVAVWALFFVIIMAITCRHVPSCRARDRRCTAVVRGACTGTRNSTWIHGDAGDETQLARPVYRYEYGGLTYEVAAGVATMLFDRSPAARLEEPVELHVNPSNPIEVYDPAYEGWFARYRVIWGLAAFTAAFALVNLLQAIG